MTTNDRKTSSSAHVTDAMARSAYNYYSGVVQEGGDGRKDLRGIRRVFAAALLSGVSMLAVGSLGASGAHAAPAPCLPAAVNGGTVYCIGTFTSTIEFDDVDDLTVVIDDSTTVNTADNAAENDGDNIGVLLNGDGTQTVQHYGTIQTGNSDAEGEDFEHHGIAVYSQEGDAVVATYAGSLVATGFDESDGIHAISGEDEGDSVAVTNDGTIVTAGEGSDGIYAYGEINATVINNNTVRTTGDEAYGIVAKGDYSSNATNNGLIRTYGEDVSAIFSYAYDATAVNGEDGTILMTGAESTGINLDGYYATAVNNGSITATDDGAVGINASGQYVDVTNSGSIDVGGEDSVDSSGIIAFGSDVTVTNTSTGTIALTGAGRDEGEDASAVRAYGGSVTLYNDGSITTGGEAEYADAVSITAESSIYVNNTGTIGTYGYDSAALRLSGEDGEYTTQITVINGDTGVITGEGNYRSGVDAEYFGTFTLTNNGDISVDDATHNNVFAVNADEGNIGRIYNHGTISGGTYVSVETEAVFYNGEDGNVTSEGATPSAIELRANETVHFENAGDVTAYSDAMNAVTLAADEGSAYAINSGTVVTYGTASTAISVTGDVSAIVINDLTGFVSTYEAGSDGISAYSSTGFVQATNVGRVQTYGEDSAAVVAGNYYSDNEYTGVVAGNAGSVYTAGALSTGVGAFSLTGSAGVYNTLGGVVVTYGDNAVGVLAVAGGTLSDANDITGSGYTGNLAAALNGGASEFFGLEFGEDFEGVNINELVDIEGFPGEDVDTADLRSFITTAGDGSHGLAAIAAGTDEEGATAYAMNIYGTIITGDEDGGSGADGIHAEADYGNALAANKYDGVITTNGDGARGVAAIASDGDARAANKYNSSIETFGEDAHGIFAETSAEGLGEDFDAWVYNSNSSIVTHGTSSDGIRVAAVDDAVVFNGSGRFGEDGEDTASITTYGDEAFGVNVTGGEGAFVRNGGSISTSGADSTGVYIVGEDEADIGNYGSIVVTGEGSRAIVAQGGDVNIYNKYDALISSTYSNSVSVGDTGTATIWNSGSIVGNIVATVADGAYFDNKYDGTITSAQGGTLIEISVEEGDIAFINDGSITQTGGEDVIADNTVRLAGDTVEFGNSGIISSGLDRGGDGFVVDIDGEYVDFDNTGSIIATGEMRAGVNVFAEQDVYATNGEDGIISTGVDEGFGVRLYAGNHAQLDNYGSISTSGDDARTVIIRSANIRSSVLNNHGSITATGEDSTAVDLDGQTVVLSNFEGATISSVAGSAIDAEAFNEEGNATAVIFNAGTITGDVTAYSYSEEGDAYVNFSNGGTVTGDVDLGAYSHSESAEVVVTSSGTITGNLSTSSGESNDTIFINGGSTIGGGIFTGDGLDTITISGTGVSIGTGIHSDEGSYVSFEQDDTVTFTDGDEGYAITGAHEIDFDSGTTVFDSVDIAMNEGTITIGEDGTMVADGTGFYAFSADETDVFGTLQVNSGAIADFSGEVRFLGGATFHTGVTSGVGGVVYGNTVSFGEDTTIYADLTVNQDIVVGDDVLIASASNEEGVTDSGATVVDNSILFNFSKVMDGAIVTSGSSEELFLRLETDETAIDTSVDANGTLNLNNIANALDEYIRTQPISNPLVVYLSQFTDPDEQRAALLQVLKDTLPEETDGQGGAVFSSTDLVFDMIMDRLGGGGFTIAQGGATGVAAGEQFLGGDGQWALWGRFGGSKAEYTPSGVNGFDADSWGATLGFDGEVATNLRVGLSYFYTDSSVDENGTAPNSKLDVTGNGVVAYMSYRPDGWYVNGSLGYSANEFDSARTSVGGTNVANYDADQFVIRTEVGKIYNKGAWEIAPNVGLRYNMLKIDGYTETGPLPVSIASRDVESIRGVIGVNARYVSELDDGGKLIPEIGVKLLNEFGDPDGTVTGSIVGGGSFSTAQTPRDDLSYGLGAGLTYEGTNGVSVRVTYDGEFQSDYDEHSIGAAVRFAF
jgi:hypothetical protein